MIFSEYKYQDVEAAKWNFERVALGSLNLIVGQTSAGKSRLLNSMFSLGMNAVREKIEKHGMWDVKFETDGKTYRYELVIEQGRRTSAVTKENLSYESGSNTVYLVKRDKSSFFFNDSAMPKLPTNQTSIRLLADEELMKPVSKGFRQILLRHFDKDELEKIAVFAVVDSDLERSLSNRTSILSLPELNLPLSLRLHYLKVCFPDRFHTIETQFREIFPSVSKCDVVRMKREDMPFETKGIVPIFVIEEKGVNEAIDLPDLSSGMKKVLLILTDIVTAPEGSVYMIDEYENSLGVNAIDFLPNFLADFQSSIQFIITTHHPYLINEIPIENWLILTRIGSNVSVTAGAELKERYGKSKQQAFTQLLNDPLFSQSDA